MGTKQHGKINGPAENYSKILFGVGWSGERFEQIRELQLLGNLWV